MTSGGKKEQRKVSSFFGAATGGVPAATNTPLRTPGSSARLDAHKAVTAVAAQFFAQLWGTNKSRPVGPPTLDRKEREKAVVVLSAAFAETFCTAHPDARSDVAEGTMNKQKLLGEVQEWWNSDAHAATLRQENRWGAGSNPSVFLQPAAGVAREGGAGGAGGSVAGNDSTPLRTTPFTTHDDKMARGVEQMEQQELDAHGYDAGGAIMVLVKASMHKWGKVGVKGGEHIGWRTNKEWAWEVCESPFLCSRACASASARVHAQLRHDVARHVDLSVLFQAVKIGIQPPSERTSARWLAKEKEAFALDPSQDGANGYVPVRSQSQIAGLLVQVQLDRARAKDMNSATEPTWKSKAGAPFKFDPLWYDTLKDMCKEVMYTPGFGPTTVRAFAVMVYIRTTPVSTANGRAKPAELSQQN